MSNYWESWILNLSSKFHPIRQAAASKDSVCELASSFTFNFIMIMTTELSLKSEIYKMILHQIRLEV